jgi:hypothetical protein
MQLGEIVVSRSACPEIDLRRRASVLFLSVLCFVTPPLTAQDGPSRHHSAFHVAAYAVGGTLLGAWSGYMASQISWSDWQDRAGRSSQRVRLSALGAGLGFLAGTLMGTRHAEARPVRPPRRADTPMPGGPITEAEIRASSARTLTELLRERRPQWLRSRGVDVLQPNIDPLESHGVRVYLNDGLLGGLETLDQVSIYSITGVQFFDTAAAILRWGAGNDDGAILLTSRATP